GVVRDVNDLLGEQANVERVQDRAHRRHGEVGLEMLLRVPRERRDPIAALDAETHERRCELLGALGELRERGATAVVTFERHDLPAREHARAVTDDRADRKRSVLHRAFEHEGLPYFPTDSTTERTAAAISDGTSSCRKWPACVWVTFAVGSSFSTQV